MSIKSTFLSAAIVCMLFSVTAKAQFHIGPKAGLNLGKIEGKSFKQEFDYNFLAGAFVELGLGGKLSLQPEFLFSQTTITRDTTVENVFKGDQIKQNLNYISIPVLLDLKLSGPLHLQAGPQFGILLNNDKTLLKNGEDAFKRGDLSMAGGVSVHFSAFRLTGRYVIGLNDRRAQDVTDGDKWKSQAIQIAAGFAF